MKDNWTEVEKRAYEAGKRDAIGFLLMKWETMKARAQRGLLTSETHGDFSGQFWHGYNVALDELRDILDNDDIR